jgi:type IV pilus assembly protein PilE
MSSDENKGGVWRRAAGFTLVELLIAIAIVSILMAAALPSYREYARRSLRAEAQAFMNTVQVRQQQFLLDTRAYATSLSDVGLTVSARVQAGYEFRLVVLPGPPQTYVLSATPRADQAGEACGTMSIDQSGARTAAKTNCW